jgi:hypothetical protein
MPEAAAEQESVAEWRKPAADECEEESYTASLADCPPSEVRLKVRLVRDLVTFHLVEFAIVLQVWSSDEWCSVVEIDTSHADECHAHQIGRSLGDRISDPEHLTGVSCIEDVQDAYALAYEHLEAHWENRVERWRSA